MTALSLAAECRASRHGERFDRRVNAILFIALAALVVAVFAVASLTA